jgi:hypothetical protein
MLASGLPFSLPFLFPHDLSAVRDGSIGVVAAQSSLALLVRPNCVFAAAGAGAGAAAVGEREVDVDAWW